MLFCAFPLPMIFRFICLSFCLSVCLSVCLPACLPVYSLSVCLVSTDKGRINIFFTPTYPPLPPRLNHFVTSSPLAPITKVSSPPTPPHTPLSPPPLPSPTPPLPLPSPSPPPYPSWDYLFPQEEQQTPCVHLLAVRWHW